ncbi:hypothetical protein AAFC00_002844 [Neodothiora populina]|uniref:Uncharacterized protein n=1 Tax=Neodothiora populina TaxID=2781224 RepID=A0ABR3P8Q7_9PEZI
MAQDQSPAKGDNDPPSTPTPPHRHDSHTRTDTESEHDTSPSLKRELKKASFARSSSAQNTCTEDKGDSNGTPHQFMAYARRVRSFTSPFHLKTKSRYLLTFTDGETAKEWWRLTQIEYPDSVRESSQLFSFRSEGVPAKAWQNARYAHLDGKWSFKQLEDSAAPPSPTAAGLPASGAEIRRSGKRGGMSVIRTPSMPTLRETGGGESGAGGGGGGSNDNNGNNNSMVSGRSESSSPELVRDADMLEDPFTPQPASSNTGGGGGGGGGAGLLAGLNDSASKTRTDLAQLTMTTDRIARSTKHANLNIDALLDSQHTNTKTTQRLQSAIEDLTEQMNELIVARQRQGTKEQAAGITVSDLRPLQTQLSQTTRALHALQETQSQQTAQLSKLTHTLVTIQQQQQQQQQQQSQSQKQKEEARQKEKEKEKALESRLSATLTAQSLAVQQDLTTQLAAQREALAACFRDEVKSAVRAVRNEVPAVAEGKCDHEVLPPPRKVNRRLVGYVYARD